MKDLRAAKARILQEVAKIQGLIQNGQQYAKALEESERTLKENDKSPALRDPEIQRSIIDPLIKVGQGAADKAKDIRTRIDTESLGVAKGALQLADRVGPRE